MVDEYERLRDRVARARGKSKNPYGGYPAALRVEVGNFVRVARADGTSYDEIGRRIGLAPGTLARWAEDERSGATAARVVPVSVVSDEGVDGAPKGGEGAIPDGVGGASVVAPARYGDVEVVSPRGYRLRGLSLADALAVLRSLP